MHRARSTSLLLLVFATSAWNTSAHTASVADRPMARANDFRRAAGVLHDGALSVHLVAQRAQWRPGSDTGIALPVDAFGEEDATPTVPGPLLRARVGTRVDVSLRNALPETLVVTGLHTRDAGKVEPLRVPPGDTGRVSFTIGAPGAFVFYADLFGGGPPIPGGHGTHLVGLIVGDTTAAPPPERIFAISFWNRLIDSTAKESDERILFLFNGRIWPYTERFTFHVGDTVRWRVVDLSAGEHPMHLHGFYFRVDSRGSFEHDSAYTVSQRRMAVTENVQAFGNFTFTWVPERAGNWIFHCHKSAHTWYGLRHTLDNTDAPDVPQTVRHDMSHVIDGMSGLVMAITVLPRPGPSDAMATQQSRATPRHVRVLVQQHAGFYGTREGLGYVTDGAGEPPRDSVRVPGAPIVVTRGEPAEVTVVNRTSYTTAVHWHGIEIESFYDGVAGWSGAGKRTAPMIAPGDSFVARFTPPRAGTFIYHTHMDDVWQLERGLYAPLIVLEPGERWDESTDHVLMIGGAFEKEKYVVALNGSTAPPPLELRAGVRQRFRVISMTVDEDADVMFYATADTSDSTLVSWRAIAKDGATLPASMATVRPARLHIAPGETYDFELTPRVPGEMRIVLPGKPSAAMRVLVRE